MPVSQSAPRLFIGSLVKHDAAFANLNGLDALTKREAVRFPAKLASSVDNLILPFRARHPCPSILYFFEAKLFCLGIRTISVEISNFSARVWYGKIIFHCLYLEQLIWGVWVSAPGHWGQFQVQVRLGKANMPQCIWKRKRTGPPRESMSEFLPPPAAKCISHFCLIAHATIYIRARKTRKLSSLLRRAREGVRFAKFIAKDLRANNGRTDFYLF
jgi:hypothetical protein